MKLVALIRLLRPKQWTKNLLVFAALIFAHQFDDPAKVWTTVVAFVALCLVSSSVYALNDVLDQERDRAHPTKQKRPIASGELGTAHGVVVMTVCLALGVALGAWVGAPFLRGLAAYLALQLLYNFLVKREAVVDVMVISTGFVLRAAGVRQAPARVPPAR